MTRYALCMKKQGSNRFLHLSNTFFLKQKKNSFCCPSVTECLPFVVSRLIFMVEDLLRYNQRLQYKNGCITYIYRIQPNIMWRQIQEKEKFSIRKSTITYSFQCFDQIPTYKCVYSFVIVCFIVLVDCSSNLWGKEDRTCREKEIKPCKVSSQGLAILISI